MSEFKNGKIYKLVCEDLIYIGSTCNTLQKRLSNHQASYKAYMKQKRTSRLTSYDLFDRGKNVDIFLIENNPCNSRKELHARERFYIESINCVNMAIPTRTNKEWKSINKDSIKKHNLTYWENHKDELKIRKKQYYKDHLNQIKTHQKKYYEENKVKILQRCREKYLVKKTKQTNQINQTNETL